MSPGERLLEAIGSRDFRGIAACFAPEASMRVLTPKGLVELSGREAVEARFRRWFAGMDGFELLDGEVTEVADRVRVRFHTRGRDPAKGEQENDHTGYAEVRDGLIVSLNVSCAGFRPTGRSSPEPLRH